MTRARGWMLVRPLFAIVLLTSCSSASPSPSDPNLDRLGVRAALGRDSSATGYDVKRSVGINVVSGPPTRSALNALRADGLGVIVWLGAYNRKVTAPCAFERNDAWIRDRVGAVAGHPAIVAYQITDEPDASVGVCPNVVDQVRARAELVASIDPTKPTYLTISKTGYSYERWADVAEILGLVIYPVSIRGYNEEMIPKAIAEAEADGVRRYWAVVQDFSTPSWYVVPTAAQLRRQFEQWGDSRVEGYVLYHWALGALETRPDHLEVLREVNGVS